jgi:hypothetical protein
MLMVQEDDAAALFGQSVAGLNPPTTRDSSSDVIRFVLPGWQRDPQWQEEWDRVVLSAKNRQNVDD